MAHEVVDEWVDRTVALENGEMRGGLKSCKTSRNYFWRKIKSVEVSISMGNQDFAWMTSFLISI